MNDNDDLDRDLSRAIEWEWTDVAALLLVGAVILGVFGVLAWWLTS